MLYVNLWKTQGGKLLASSIPHSSPKEAKETADKSLSIYNRTYVAIAVPLDTKLGLKPPLDFTRPVCTKAGAPVRVLCTDRKMGGIDKPIFGLIQWENEGKQYEYVQSWYSDGKCRENSSCLEDLIQLED